MKNEVKNKIEYRKVGDYYIPNLVISKDEYQDYPIGKYGHLRLKYLKENNRVEYEEKLLDGTLRKDIVEVDMEAKKRVKEIINELKLKNNLTEEMKNSNQLYWGGMMNNFKNTAEEIVLKELIYVQNY